MFECYRKTALRIDLTNRHFEARPLGDDLLADYVGGMGFGVKLLTDEVNPKADAFSPENKLILSIGPLTGTLAPMHAQACVVTKSPLTGGIINSYAGGYIGGAVKATPYDVVIIEGKAKHLSYVTITPQGVRFVECPELAGLPTAPTEEAVRRASGCPDMQVISIGSGGEKLVRFASLITGTRAFGRGGLGAVFGSKNLKAIGLYGEQDVCVADSELFESAARAMRDKLSELLSNRWHLLSMFAKDGTGAGMAVNNEKRAMATMNHLKCTFDGVPEIDGQAFIRKYPTRPVSCLGCPVHCSMLRTMETKTSFGDTWTRGPEYETMYSLGSLCSNADSDALLRANLVCEEYGFDTLSAGVTVAFAMECAKRGILPVNLLGDDTPLEFGNGTAVVKLLELIGRREGVGDVLAEGTKRAAQIIGQGSTDFALQAKGMEFAAWMPERMRGIALTFATSNRGACHKRAVIGDELFRLPMDSVENKAAMTKEIQDKVNGLFTLICCRFAEFGVPLEFFTNMLSAAAGIPRDPAWLMTLGEKLWNMERMFNLRAGVTKADDWLPERCFEPVEGFPEDAIPFSKEILTQMLQEYYQLRGWDSDGHPTEQKLKSLGIPVTRPE